MLKRKSVSLLLCHTSYEATNLFALNQTIQSQTKACIVKSPCDIAHPQILRSVQQEILTDVSGQPIGSIFKDQQVRKTEYSTTDVT